MSTSVLEAVRLLLHEGVSLRDLPEFLVRSRRRAVITTTLVAFAAGAIGLALPRWYSSGATLTIDAGTSLPEGSSVLGLASQLGLTAGGAGSGSPQFYADLLTSRILLERVLAAHFPLGADSGGQSLDAYWNEGKTLDARGHAHSLERIHKHFAASANPRTGVITLTLDGPSPTVARLMADTALAALNDLVVSIRRRHASGERQFLEQRWSAIRDSLTAHEDALRAFYERNRQITSPELQFEELRLRREVDRVQVVYTQLGTQLEQARIQEVRDVPAISVIDPPTVPTRKSSPRISLFLLTGLVVGATLTLTIALLQMALAQLRRG